MKLKEKNSQIQEFTSKREEERKQAKNLALKYNEVFSQYNTQLNQAKTLQNEKDNLAKVFPYKIFLSLSISYFLSGLVYLKFAGVDPQGEQK